MLICSYDGRDILRVGLIRHGKRHLESWIDKQSADITYRFSLLAWQKVGHVAESGRLIIFAPKVAHICCAAALGGW